MTQFLSRMRVVVACLPLLASSVRAIFIVPNAGRNTAASHAINRSSGEEKPPSWHPSRAHACSDRRKPGKCDEKKRAGLCPIWGCDYTCDHCNARTAGANRGNRAQKGRAPKSTRLNVGNASCTDQRHTTKCEEKKRNGQCDTWGCDLTCGKCPWQAKKMDMAAKRTHNMSSRPSVWWVKHVRASGGYATAIVPTLCKRIARIHLLLDKLTLMRCIGEVMFVSRGICIQNLRNELLRRSPGPRQTPIVVVDMGEWDNIYGPAARFMAATRARESVLVHCDDDEIPCELQVCKLAVAALREPVGLYGHHKRVCDRKGYRAPFFPGHIDAWAKQPFNVLLTLFASTSRIFNDAFVRHFGNYAEPLASTKGNGEDIAYNHFLKWHFNRTPTFVANPTCGKWLVNGSNLYDRGFSKLNDQTGISARANHYKLRKRMCRHLWYKELWSDYGRFGPKFYTRLIPDKSTNTGPRSAM